MKICAFKNCNNEFVERGPKLYCSRYCKQYAKDSRGKSEIRKASNRKRVKLRKSPYLKYKKDYCEQCGFVAIHPCQLDVDHVDGNHSNNDTSNLKTLCANCHRLKTFINKDWLPLTNIKN